MEPILAQMGGMAIWMLLLIPGLLIGFYAQFRLSRSYARYKAIGTASGVTGADAARAILDSAGLHHIPVREVPGHLTDHYDPTQKQLCLSADNYRNASIAAVGIAAHEAGHALQHKASYAPLQIRMALVPITGIATQAALWLTMGSMFINIAKLAMVGVAIYAVIALFQIITLPVEYDASSRAKRELQKLRITTPEEDAGVNNVLGAAALTYVAAMVTSVMYLLQFFLMSRRNDD